ncbi:MAG: DUF177 domain-containing protein, partial [Burkholderiales bacterium]
MQTTADEARPGPAPPIDDVRAFVRRRARARGATRVAEMPRVLPALASAAGQVQWSVRGSPAEDAAGRPAAFIELELSGRVALGCVRCLEPVEVEIRSAQRFKIVREEVLAEREDAGVDDYDVLASTGALDLAELIQDELLLALPIAPAHAHCELPLAARGRAPPAPRPQGGPAAAPGGGSGATGRDPGNPFAVLAEMRRGPDRELRGPRARDDGPPNEAAGRGGR